MSGCDNKILKAIELPNPNYRDETEIHQKADAMHKVVNHAHQRNPKKKW
ncbi:transcriptional regulator [Photorhabdus laumondii subsp. laumondii]|nr:transcriptional regulator [Photorhabdus laumondii subsp. laumondii]